MIKRKNEYGRVKFLIMNPVVSIKCPETQAKLQLRATVEFHPGEFLPEFADAQNSIRQKLENREMAVEAAAEALVDFFNEYGPKAVSVKVDVINNSTFFPVALYAESYTKAEATEAEPPPEEKAGKKKSSKESERKGKEDDLKSESEAEEGK